jgi:hypothetical protein
MAVYPAAYDMTQNTKGGIMFGFRPQFDGAQQKPVVRYTPIIDPLKILIKFLVKCHISLASSHFVLLWRKYFTPPAFEK